jgi:hypothetical protein
VANSDTLLPDPDNRLVRIVQALSTTCAPAPPQDNPGQARHQCVRAARLVQAEHRHHDSRSAQEALVQAKALLGAKDLEPPEPVAYRKPSQENLFTHANPLRAAEGR